MKNPHPEQPPKSVVHIKPLERAGSDLDVTLFFHQEDYPYCPPRLVTLWGETVADLYEVAVLTKHPTKREVMVTKNKVESLLKKLNSCNHSLRIREHGWQNDYSRGIIRTHRQDVAKILGELDRMYEALGKDIVNVDGRRVGEEFIPVYPKKL